MIDATLVTGRETTLEERQTWGTCPVCSAPHGEWCFAEVGIQLGTPLGGGRMQTGSGAHLGRLQVAPKYVRVVGSQTRCNA